jgi:hypothetical protein
VLQELRAYNIALITSKIHKATIELEESNKRIASVTEELKQAFVEATGSELSREAFSVYVRRIYHHDKMTLALIERITSNKKKVIELKNLAYNEVESAQTFVSKFIK